MAILVTGGAGYIGSVCVDLLREQGEDVVVYDSLARGFRDAVASDVPFVQGSIGDVTKIGETIKKYGVDSVIHFAAYAYVGESVTDPALYFQNNVANGLNLLDAMRANGVNKLVFSSTCATYGEPHYLPLDEKHPTNPESPYGRSKLMMEQVFDAYSTAYDLRAVALRYFNVAGAAANRGERHDPETHIIPLVLRVAQGKADHVSIFGDDYPTDDGTCIRDYIHVVDLGLAHIAAVKYLRDGGASHKINIGTGHGYSVLDVINSARRITGHPIPSQVVARRPGDPSGLYASAQKAKDVLGWQAQRDLDAMIASAWAYMQQREAAPVA